MAKSRLAKANGEIAKKVVGAYKAVEEGVVGTYGYIEDAFVEQFLTHDGESVEDAKARLGAEQEQRRAQERQGPGVDYVRQGQEHTMERVRRAREAAHVPGRQTEAN